MDHIADRTDGLDQAPKRTEEAEEHQKAGHVAGDVTCLVEACGDRVENAAHQLRRHGHAADATAEDRRHWRKQHWRPVDGEAGVGQAEIVDPGDLRIKPQHLPERKNNADHLDAEDQPVKAGVGHECDLDLLVQHERNKSDQDDEDQHPEQEDPWRRQLERIEFFGHEFRRLRLQAPAAHYGTDKRLVKSSCAGTRAYRDKAAD